MSNPAPDTAGRPRWRPDAQRLETVPCPLCGGQRFTLLANSDRYDMDLHTVGCETCGLVLTNPQPSEAALDEFYRQHYRDYYQKTEVASLEYIRAYRKDERAAAAAAWMQQQGLLRPGMAVLDIGASEGCLLHAIGQLQPDALRVAVEPNPQFGAFAVGHAGCTLHDSLDTLRAAAPQQRFDLVTINHVYEHVKQPAEFLRQLAALLAPGARVYIDVPDVTRYQRLEDLHIAHLYHFGPDTLRRAAQAGGMAVDRLEAHQPVNHPLSLRCVLHAQPGEVPAPLRNLQEGWAQTRRAGQRAWHYHRRRWGLGRRIAHWLRWR